MISSELESCRVTLGIPNFPEALDAKTPIRHPRNGANYVSDAKSLQIVFQGPLAGRVGAIATCLS